MVPVLAPKVAAETRGTCRLCRGSLWCISHEQPRGELLHRFVGDTR